MRVKDLLGRAGFGLVVFGLVLLNVFALQRSEDEAPWMSVRDGSVAAWGRPGLPRCSTILTSSATTIVFGCPPWRERDRIIV